MNVAAHSTILKQVQTWKCERVDTPWTTLDLQEKANHECLPLLSSGNLPGILQAPQRVPGKIEHRLPIAVTSSKTHPWIDFPHFSISLLLITSQNSFFAHCPLFQVLLCRKCDWENTQSLTPDSPSKACSSFNLHFKGWQLFFPCPLLKSLGVIPYLIPFINKPCHSLPSKCIQNLTNSSHFLCYHSGPGHGHFSYWLLQSDTYDWATQAPLEWYF